MADDILNQIDEKVKKNKVMLYMKGSPDFPQCGFSAHTVEILRSYGYPFATEDVLADPRIREGIKRYSNWPTIPQVFIDGKFIGGCDILHELHERGELESMLKAAFAKGE
ncbi:MAG TPA: Grx4 family monothiol glutaredoxin [candidate division Zixibacteria bacterium]|nr:Grx4 family monothiol glutaredoxin [candidate division Zixibacteria bacterium]